GSYTENLKRELGQKGSSEGYTRSIKNELGPKPGGDSAIADFKSGKTLKPNKGSMKTHHAFAIKVATSIDRSYVGEGSEQELSYSEIYGDRMVPEINFAYEYHPFESGVLRGLGLLAGLGVSFKKGNGKLAFTG